MTHTCAISQRRLNEFNLTVDDVYRYLPEITYYERQATVLTARLNGKTAKEIAEQENVTPSRIYDIERSALRKIQIMKNKHDATRIDLTEEQVYNIINGKTVTVGEAPWTITIRMVRS